MCDIDKIKKVVIGSRFNCTKCNNFLLSLLDTAKVKKDSEKPNNDKKKLNGLDVSSIQLGDIVGFRNGFKSDEIIDYGVVCKISREHNFLEVGYVDLRKKNPLSVRLDLLNGWFVESDRFHANKPKAKVGDVHDHFVVKDVYGAVCGKKGNFVSMTWMYKIHDTKQNEDVLYDEDATTQLFNDKADDTDEQELLELEAEALALILQLEVNKGNQRKSSSNSTPKYKVGDVFVASNNDRYWKITSVLTSNEDITYFVDEYRKGKSKTYHTDQQSFSESELENKMLAQGAVLQKDKENKNSYPERNGKITADVLKKTFDFRYVNVDINLDEKQEQDMLDVSYNTFRQLAMLLNIPMNAIGLGRNLTLNIGLMRMDLTTGACYSPQYRALNFKGLESFKHIAHEWFHAFDHYLNYAHDNMNAKGLFSKDCYNETTHYGITAQDNIAAIIKAIDDTPYYSRSAGVAKASRYGKYWTSNCELLARAFEVYVKNLMEKHNINNSHLVSLFPNNPYPNYSDPKDMPIQDAFKVLFDGLTMRKTIYGDEALYGTKHKPFKNTNL